MNVCAQVVCADAVVPLQAAIAPCAPPIFEAIVGMTVWVASYSAYWNFGSTPRVVSAKNANCASPPRLLTVGGDDSPRRSLTALPHCCADSRHSRRWIGASGAQAVEPPPPPVPPVPPMQTPFVQVPLQG